MMLGEMGAKVVKIETPHGRDTAADIHHGTPVHYHSFNRGKRNMAIDTKTELGRDAVRLLVADADVYMQNMRPGVAVITHTVDSYLRFAGQFRQIACD